jgi:hypothetical protein
MRKRERNLFRKALERKRTDAQGRRGMRDPRAHQGAEADFERRLMAHDRPPDVPDPRTKGAGHGQKTADKWNQ